MASVSVGQPATSTTSTSTSTTTSTPSKPVARSLSDIVAELGLETDGKQIPHRLLRRRVDPINSAGYEEMTVAVVGSVDSGKSSTIGTIVSGILDDGDGLSRSVVFMHPHEHATGRTSSISYKHFVDADSKRILTFVDLAGHEMYLRTTLNGLSSTMPDCAIVCISDKITDMTREHMGLCIALNIPMIILFTKIDMVPKKITTDLVRDIKMMLKNSKGHTRVLFHVKTAADIKILPVVSNANAYMKTESKIGVGDSASQPAAQSNVRPNTTIPFILTSNKTGDGLNLILSMIRHFPKKVVPPLHGFNVEHIYHVPGIGGSIVSGIGGADIHVGDSLYIGPFGRGDYMPVNVRSIHNDYRFGIETLPAGKKGCLALSIKSKDKMILRKGMVLSHTIPPNTCESFVAKIKIFHHATSIQNGYQAHVNCGMLREQVIFTDIKDLSGNPIGIIRSGDEAYVTMKFLRNLNHVEIGQPIAFRENKTRGIGTIIEPVVA